MDLRFEKRDTFYVSGYSVETNEASLEEDVALLRKKYEDKLRMISDRLYFVAWEGQASENDMIYHFSVETPEVTPDGMTRVEVPATHFAVATVPAGVSVLEAWYEFFEKGIPALGATIDTDYDIYFECFDENGVCELWIPVVKSDGI